MSTPSSVDFVNWPIDIAAAAFAAVRLTHGHHLCCDISKQRTAHMYRSTPMEQVRFASVQVSVLSNVQQLLVGQEIHSSFLLPAGLFAPAVSAMRY